MKLNDSILEKLLMILSRYAINEMEGIVDFDGKNDIEREELIKIVLKTCEVTALTILPFLNGELKIDQLDKIYEAMSENNNQLVNELYSKLTGE